MPSYTHEVLVELFRSRPSLVVEVLSGLLGGAVPAYQGVVVSPGELTEASLPKELRADAVLVYSVGERPVLGVVVEVQLSENDDKYWSWPAYLISLRTRLRCMVVLLVVCPNRATAVWAARPIETAPGWVLVPFVLGPDQIAVVTDPVVASRDLERAVLSAIAHSDHPEHDQILAALFTALDGEDADQAAWYTDFVLAALPDAVRAFLEKDMIAGTKFRSDFARRYFSQGHAEGEAKGHAEGLTEGLTEGEAKGRAEGLSAGRVEGEVRALLTILATRGIRVPKRVHARITTCTDLDQLETWIGRAINAATIQDVFNAS